MNSIERKRFVSLHYWLLAILFAVYFWDTFVLKVSSWNYYYPFRIGTIGAVFLIAHLIRKEKLKPVNGFDMTCIIWFLYSYIGTKYLHSTYIFTFYEGIVFISFIYTGSLLRYSIIYFIGMGLALMSLQYMPEPDFVKAGFSVRHHLQLFSIIFGVLAFIVYWFFNRQREVVYKMEQKFASIGRQSAFLLHELKSPLSRFMTSNSKKDNRDAEYIFSIVEAVELLITYKENLLLVKLNWEDIKTYLENEFGEMCEHYKIQLEITGFDGEGFGHQSTIRLALKNLVKNAVEAIAFEENQGTIKVSRQNNTIEVSNNGSVITKEKLDQLFTPFFSGKNSKTNYGIGLHFVESVVKAHNGNIGFNVEDGWNVFRVKLGEIS
jgi:signal transduction histidine kinase